MSYQRDNLPEQAMIQIPNESSSIPRTCVTKKVIEWTTRYVSLRRHPSTEQDPYTVRREYCV